MGDHPVIAQNSISAGVSSQTTLGELTSWLEFRGLYFVSGEKRMRKGKKKKKETKEKKRKKGSMKKRKRAKRLSPVHISCYATAHISLHRMLSISCIKVTYCAMRTGCRVHVSPRAIVLSVVYILTRSYRRPCSN